jgi:hypothetical protein
MSPTPPLIDLPALEREAVRLCHRYIDEVVLPFDLCPWAAPALRQQRVEIIAISRAVEAPGAPLLEAARSGSQALASLAGRPDIELVLLLYPRFELGRSDFDALLRSLRDAPASAEFVMAAFHPEASLDTSNPERLVPFLRRSPDPMVQAVRRRVLERIDPGRGSGTAFVPLAEFLAGGIDVPPEPSPRERVAQANRETVLRCGAEQLERTLADIHEDRRRTYEGLGLLRKS